MEEKGGVAMKSRGIEGYFRPVSSASLSDWWGLPCLIVAGFATLPFFKMDTWWSVLGGLTLMSLASIALWALVCWVFFSIHEYVSLADFKNAIYERDLEDRACLFLSNSKGPWCIYHDPCYEGVFVGPDSMPLHHPLIYPIPLSPESAQRVLDRLRGVA